MPTYCKVKRTMLAQQLDSWDTDTLPESAPLHGNVTFTPQLADGDAVTLYDNDKPVTIVPAPIKARISDGQIFHRGVDYIELLAGGDRMNPATLVWKATFTNLQANGVPVKLRPVVFEAVPDGTVDLTIVAPAPGTAGQGVVKGRDGDHIEGLAVEGTNLVLRVKDGDGVTRSEQIAIGEVAKTVANDAVTRAEADAEAAKGSAEAAAGSASTASARAGEADVSAKAAKVSEDRAKGSEVNAKASEDSAAAHAESAGEKAQQVEQGLTEVADLAWALDEGVRLAGVSASAAKSSEDAAKASESAAKQSETNAASSATAAAVARDSAQAYAGGAQTQAQAAQTQGDRAKTEADRAATSAAQAAETVASGVPDATTSAKGKVKLAGDLAGTADAPTVPGLATKANASHSHAIGDVTSLQSTLDSKAPTVHTHATADINGLSAYVGQQIANSTQSGGAIESYAKQVVDQTTANAVNAATDSIKWDRGRITTATDPLTLAPGKYTVFTASIATSMGLPGNQRGVLTVSYVDWPGKLYGKFTWEIDPPSGYELWRATSYNGTLSAWSRQFDGYVKAPLTSSTVLTDLSPGKYPVTSTTIAEALKLPNPGMGMLTVDWIGLQAYQRFDWITGVNPTTHWRVSAYNRNLGSAVWEQLHPVAAAETKPSAAQKATDSIVDALIADADPTVDYATVRASLVSEMKTRIGTPAVGDAGAIALVYDHGTTAFRDWIWPELKARGLPATLALCPETHLDPAKQDSRHLATVAEIKQMVIDGLVIASHSGDHGGAKTYTDVWRQVVVSKQTLEETFATKVDCWVQPGYSLSEGNYMGFGTGQSADAYTNTIGGRLLEKTYPVITGYVGTESTYPANADLPVGSRRSLFEKKEDIPVVRGLVQKAADEKLKHITFVHPYSILDASDTYATKQEYLAFLDFVVQLRDVGKLKVLTLPQLAVARP